MENIEAFLYEAFVILVFCLAVGFLFSLMSGLARTQELTAENLYDEHVFYSVSARIGE